MEIPNILNASSTRFTRNFQKTKKKLQQILFLHLNCSNQTNFGMLVLWISRDQTSIYFLSRNHLVVDVATLALGSRPKQRLARVRAKREARESHLILPVV
jgi:hypothetical protein